VHFALFEEPSSDCLAGASFEVNVVRYYDGAAAAHVGHLEEE
jgi:hypothetical protein